MTPSLQLNSNPPRSFFPGKTRRFFFGFQRQEQDEELWEGAVNYRFRIEDPRLGRFFSIDPLQKKFPWNSSFAFSENKVIAFLELEGLETVYFGSEKVDFTGMSQLQVEKELERLDDKHYGNMTAQDVQNYMKPGEIWQVRNVWSSGVCTGTIFAKYNNEQDRQKDQRSYSSEIRRSKSQAFWSLLEDSAIAQEGREGLDAWCGAVGSVGSGLEYLGEVSGIPQFKVAGKTFSSFTEAAQVIADYETLPKELADKKTAIRVCFSVATEVKDAGVSSCLKELEAAGVSIPTNVGLDKLKDMCLEQAEKSYYESKPKK